MVSPALVLTSTKAEGIQIPDSELGREQVGLK